MRWALAISPTNYPLFVCHLCNEIVQLYQLGRCINARYLTDGKDGKTDKPQEKK